jgi:hypothetical protein
VCVRKYRDFWLRVCHFIYRLNVEIIWPSKIDKVATKRIMITQKLDACLCA